MLIPLRNFCISDGGERKNWKRWSDWFATSVSVMIQPSLLIKSMIFFFRVPRSSHEPEGFCANGVCLVAYSKGQENHSFYHNISVFSAGGFQDGNFSFLEPNITLKSS